jgi:hypothetical protein
VEEDEREEEGHCQSHHWNGSASLPPLNNLWPERCVFGCMAAQSKSARPLMVHVTSISGLSKIVNLRQYKVGGAAHIAEERWKDQAVFFRPAARLSSVNLIDLDVLYLFKRIMKTKHSYRNCAESPRTNHCQGLSRAHPMLLSSLNTRLQSTQIVRTRQ